MHRNWMIAGVAVAIAALFAVGALGADEPTKDDKAPKRATKEQLKDMMTKLHKGEKAPLARVLMVEPDVDQPGHAAIDQGPHQPLRADRRRPCVVAHRPERSHPLRPVVHAGSLSRTSPDA